MKSIPLCAAIVLIALAATQAQTFPAASAAGDSNIAVKGDTTFQPKRGGISTKLKGDIVQTSKRLSTASDDCAGFQTDLKTILELITLIVAITGLFVAMANFTIARRAHILDVYHKVLDRMDTDELRDTRRQLYELMENQSKMDLFRTQCDAGVDQINWGNIDKELVDKLARAFDQLGLLVREGRVPVNLIAEFYASPTLRCWCALAPYVVAVRVKRSQPGHLWEWEHLVYDVIIENLEKGDGIWKGVLIHDQLEDFVTVAATAKMKGKTAYAPRRRPWEIAGLWDIRKW